MSLCVEYASQNLSIWITTLFTSVLSLLGSSFMLCSFFCFGKYRSAFPKLVTYLALCDFGWAVTVIIRTSILLHGISVSYEVCVAIRLCFQFFSSASIFWTACISFYLLTSLKSDGKQLEGSKAMWVLFHMWSWLFPVVVGAFMVGFNLIGGGTTDHMGVCFPKQPYETTLWFGPNVVGFVIIVYNFVAIHLHFNKKRKISMQLDSLATPVEKKMTLYLVVLMVCWLLDFISQMTAWVLNCEPFILNLFSSSIMQGQGALDGICFGITTKSFHKFLGRVGPFWFVVTLVFSPLMVVPSFIYFLYRVITEPARHNNERQSLVPVPPQ